MGTRRQGGPCTCMPICLSIMLQVGCKVLRVGRVGCRGLKCNMLHGFERESCNILQHFWLFVAGGVLIQIVLSSIDYEF